MLKVTNCKLCNSTLEELKYTNSESLFDCKNERCPGEYYFNFKCNENIVSAERAKLLIKSDSVEVYNFYVHPMNTRSQIIINHTKKVSIDSFIDINSYDDLKQKVITYLLLS